MCRLFGYSKQAFYKKNDNHLQKAYERKLVKSLVMDIRRQLPRIGTRKLYFMMNKSLQERNLKIGRDKLFSILKEEYLLVGKRRRYTKTTNSKHWLTKYPNIAKNIQLTMPEQLWVADITYLHTKEGHEYLHLVTDAYSKQIMGYELSSTLKASSTIKAMKMALSNRKYTHGLVHHSDRGLQYCSYEYTELLKRNSIGISMTEQYDPYENAVAERVNGILKDEFGLDMIFNNDKELAKQLNQAVDLYNNLRPHLSINMLTPKQAHSQREVILKKWNTKKPVQSNEQV